MEKHFSKFGVPPQPKRVKVFLDERELDLLRMSVKGLYSYYFARIVLSDSSNRDLTFGLILLELKDLYWKLFNLS